MTKKIFCFFLLCVLFYACAGTQTNSDNVQPAPANPQNVSSDTTAAKAPASGRETSAVVGKDAETSKSFVQSLYLIKDTKMRKEAKNLSKVVATLKKGETVEKLDVSGNWIKVKSSSGKTGWVYYKYVSENK